MDQSAAADQEGDQTASEILARRRMQNRIAQRKSRQRRAEMARERRNREAKELEVSLHTEPGFEANISATGSETGPSGPVPKTPARNAAGDAPTFSVSAPGAASGDRPPVEITDRPFPQHQAVLPPLSNLSDATHLRKGSGAASEELEALGLTLESPHYFLDFCGLSPGGSGGMLPSLGSSGAEASCNESNTVSGSQPPTPSGMLSPPLSAPHGRSSSVASTMHTCPVARPSLRLAPRIIPPCPQALKTSTPTAASREPSRIGRTALHISAERGNIAMVTFLVENDVDLDTPDGQGRTALHLAVESGHFPVVAKLLEMGADTDLVDCNGLSPIHTAAESDREEILSLLIREGADIHARVAATDDNDRKEDL
ncbi:uncharacterized protein PG986_012421 [Apiospora aurea]|uniref:BZIP domain-containing protein n=1 Tax=Apiospora aurea TaxID=335848 RepID=A0ABR1PZX2_9PEZI